MSGNSDRVLNITHLPFNKLIGLELAGPENSFMVGLPDAPHYLNHLGTVHASALLSVAEAGSGEFLLRSFGQIAKITPVVRKMEAKFRKPARGAVTSRCSLDRDVLNSWIVDLESRGRVSVAIPVDVIDSTGSVVMSAMVEWFVSMTPKNA